MDGGRSMNIPYPVIQGNSDDETYHLEKKYYAILPDGKMLTVEAGFSFDGASIPEILYSFIGDPYSGRYVRAAFIHDCLYASELLPRKECDNIFLEIMKEHGVNWAEAKLDVSSCESRRSEVWADHTDESISEARKYITLK